MAKPGKQHLRQERIDLVILRNQDAEAFRAPLLWWLMRNRQRLPPLASLVVGGDLPGQRVTATRFDEIAGEARLPQCRKLGAFERRNEHNLVCRGFAGRLREPHAGTAAER